MSIALQIEPNSQAAQYLLGEACYAQDKIPEAISSGKEVLKLGPHPEAYLRFKKAEEVEVAYWEGLSAVGFMVARNGRQVLCSLLDLLWQNYTLESALQAASGESLVEFEKKWRASLVV